MAIMRFRPPASGSGLWTTYLAHRPLLSRFSTHAVLLSITRSLHSNVPVEDSPISFRQEKKDEAKKRKASGQPSEKRKCPNEDSHLDDWELTVGVEIHAQLNTESKLFSKAGTSSQSLPNTNTALFDLALPGSQPQFQKATLIPAIRAALALNCQVQRKSTFDRKHYFYPDQPAGYQITQYHSPLATDGYILLDRNDGIATEETEDEIRVGIKQVQMEQDTAKTLQQPPDLALLDFNRVGHPLIEIITLPQLHHPRTVAACVRKIQQALQAVSAVTTGMELGGLRADINVSVRRRDDEAGKHSYHGVFGLGQRTEIKNLSSFKAVEDAIVAERDRQIAVLESGGRIEGETRGWSLGATATTRLRGKEGEVDYRYMPDSDLPPVIVGQSLIDQLQRTLPVLPDEQTKRLVDDYGLTVKDAKTLINLDDGLRLDYFQDVFQECQQLSGPPKDHRTLGKLVGDWLLMELGGLFGITETEFSPDVVSPKNLADMIDLLSSKHITGKSAKEILAMNFEGDQRSVTDIVDQENLAFKELSEAEYATMAGAIIAENPEITDTIRKGGKMGKGKINVFVGLMMKQGQGRVDAAKARKTLETLLEDH